MKFALITCLTCIAPLLTFAAGPAATQPVAITVHLHNATAQTVLAELSKQAGAPFPLFPPDLLEKGPLPNVTLDLDRQPFWAAMEQLSSKTGLEPVLAPEDPYPRFQLGLGGGDFWQEPHVIAGPVVLFANEVQRTNTVELGKKKHTFERELTLNLTAFAEPGLRVLFASPEIKAVVAVDEKGQPLTVAAEDPVDAGAQNDAESGVFTWNLAVALNSPTDPAVRKIARLRGRTHLRVQTAEQRVEVDDVMKVRNVARNVAGAPFTFRSLKKADIEFILQVSLRRDKKSESEWRDLHHSLYSGQLALYDDKGRLVAGRATENGGEYHNNRIDATLRFIREPGVSDPQAGEPFKLVWLAPTAAKDLPIEFELQDLPIPE
ncbi:MAG: hypothetical protein JWN40_5362 [Phycisphaerales bacterium]|nr:hypothetical protein [Phycisphaerales bacterium]